MLATPFKINGMRVEWTVPECDISERAHTFNFPHEAELFVGILRRDPDGANRLHAISIVTAIPLGALVFAYHRGKFASVAEYLDSHIAKCMSALADLQKELSRRIGPGVRTCP